MPEPIGAQQRYMPGLDGIRAVAVAAVVAYHLGVPWMPGGLLGVGVFFTLSGYLITDILLSNWEASASLQLRTFWARRARRLLPALALMLAVVVVWAAVARPAQLGAMRGDVLAAATYVSNWWLIFQHVSYFARFGPPAPLGHLWSLAVEEQFYLIWPWLLWLGLLWSRRRQRARAESREPGAQRPSWARQQFWPLAGVTVLLAAGSAVEMAVLYRPSLDPSRVYDGTDTRAFALLLGAALAMVWPSKGLKAQLSPHARRVIDAVGVAGLVAIALLFGFTNQYSAFLYRGGMALLALATVLVVGAAAHPASRLGPALGWGPLRWVGVRSYGIYLWHYPVIVLTSPPSSDFDTGVDLPRAVLQVAATVILADLSWRLVETPVRHGAIGRLWSELKGAPSWQRAWSRRRWAALCTVPASVVLVLAALTGVMPSVSATSPGSLGAAGPAPHLASPGNSEGGRPKQRPTTTVTATSGPAKATTSTTVPGTTSTTVPPPLETSCKQVVHIGDSTSESLTSAEYLPDPSQRLQAQYARVGVTRSIMRISGGRSIVETVDNQPNAYTVAERLVKQGYQGCWVIAMGTNDAANVYVGSNVGMAARVQRTMSVIGHQPVVWVNVKTLRSSGPYSETNMEKWDSTLVNACRRYPNMRVFNWAGIAKPQWFIADGIHYTSQGSAPRAAAIADALATAFPAVPAKTAKGAGAPGSSCLVNASADWHLPAFIDGP